MVSGSIGFGGFYSLLCFSADHAPGWVVATTWQLTIIASLVVLVWFGRSFPKRIWLFSAIVFTGVLMVNLSHFQAAHVQDILKGAIPVLLAAFCYPTGNQMVWEAQNGNRLLPRIQSRCLGNPFNKVLLLSLGSLPFWCLLVGLTTPAAPSTGQLVNTALVAFFSGICATSLFLLARSRSRRASELAAVDATQSSEVVFALLGEILLLGAAPPSGIAVMGVILVFTGLALFIYDQKDKR
jgi:drug/metabolite transporter (DMT)-like permease